jgi:apolipoprotein N-acyltransferase
MNKNIAFQLAAAVAIGFGLRFVVSLEPLWWLAWFLPGLLLALALRAGEWAARGHVVLAAAIGVTVNVPFFLKVMPLVPVIVVMALQTLLWSLIIVSARRIILSFRSGWTVLALPVIGVAADTLLAHLTPDGNWGSLAYTQADALPVAQLASLSGVGGVLFLLLLANSAVALLIHGAWQWSGGRLALPAAALLIVAGCGYGTWRLQAANSNGAGSAKAVTYGIVSIDDFVASIDSGLSRNIWQQYRSQVVSLAAAGAKVVLLPEKINVMPVASAEALKGELADMARENRVWLVAGLGVDTGTERRNEAWWFAPDGTLVTNYLKHFLAPPEREFVSGGEFPVNRIDDITYGIAICKDMHFASLGRAFGARDAAVMLVPAWDFHDDAWMAANMTKMRGVENGYSVVRASRDGLLSVSDAWGRVLAVKASASLPGASLLATVNVGPRVPTIYTRIGDSLGWICVAVMALLIPWSFVRRRKALPAAAPGIGS